MSFVLFLTEGGAHVGYGHIARCITLAAAVRKRGIEAQFLIAGGSRAEALVVRCEFRVSAIADITADEQVASAIRQSGAAAVIIDSYAASEAALAATGIPTIVLDDLGDRRLPVDLVLNPALSAEEVGYERLTRARLLLGPCFALVRTEFSGHGSPVIKPRVERMFVSLGGGDNGRLLANLVSLRELFGPSTLMELAVGPFSSKPELPESPRIVVKREPNMSNAMAHADLAIAAGGQTLFELAAMGLPAIVIRTAQNQARNIEAFVRAGTVCSAGAADDPLLNQNVQNCFEHLRQQDVRQRMSNCGRQIVDGRGADRVASEILRLLQFEE